MTPALPLRFEGTIERFPMKGGWYYVLFPHDAKALFGQGGFIPVQCTVNGVPDERSLLPMGDGRHFIALKADLRKRLGLSLGSHVMVEILALAGAQEPELPPELAAIFELCPDEGKLFARLPRTTRKWAIYWLTSAKTALTREKRAAELLRRLQSGVFHLGGKPVTPEAE